MISLTSAELNYLVFRYLHESGFTHSAFAFGYEAGINKSTIDGNIVPPAALVTFVQKGLQYLELEANLGSSDADVDDDFSYIQPLDLITKDAYELQRIIKEKRENLQKDRSKTNEKDNETKQKDEVDRAREGEEEKGMGQEEQNDKDVMSKDPEEDKGKKDPDHNGAEKSEDKVQIEHEEKNGDAGGPEPMEISMSPISLRCELPSSDVAILEGHSSEVFACAWSPSGSLLASGSGDSTARIWTIPDEISKSSMQNNSPTVKVLRHFKRTNEKSKDVTTLDWNGDGTLLATGSYDGQARIWNRDGELRTTLNKHKGPIFSLKWNKKGDYLLSGSVDRTAIVWDIRTGECRQQFEFHSAPTLDVDWRNNVSFATCSTDTMIQVCKIGEKLPMKTFSGHEIIIAARNIPLLLKWLLQEQSGKTILTQIWSLKQDKHLHDLKEHSKEIYTIRWSPTGPGTNNPNQQLVLASASFDSTIKLWDVEQGRLIYSFNGHRDPVYSVAFSPNGEFLASGSMDKCMHIWSVKEGKIVKTYAGNGGIFEVCWNKEGNKVAACFANNVVSILDFRM
ncbi:Guanine nucleotide-binding protein, beta subunit [Trema orientale]|uniref:Guanine nucleotide-binding protein, beta subunit n=1 Tax=Trema orientale TaxID=63057 RepID=A0A2P5BDM5_TREOI|nr:Guanine nucleotide-binding protein, beta subunit [Trema orientale]